MTFAFEVDPHLDPVNGMQDDDFASDYEGFFEEEDYTALGVDPCRPTEAKPGSEGKVLMLAARYAAGLPLWHEEDCYDHGPDRSEADDNQVDDDFDELDV